MSPLLVFEGIDGSGKSTLRSAVVEALHDRGRLVVGLDSPATTFATGQLLRRALEGAVQITPSALLWLFAAEAVEADQLVRDYLRRDYIVVMDRFTPISAYVYQSEQHSEGAIESVLSGWHFQWPHATFIMTVPPAVAVQRTLTRAKAPDVLYEHNLDAKEVRFAERQQYYRRILLLGGPHPGGPGYELDGTQPVAALVTQVLKHLYTCGMLGTPP